MNKENFADFDFIDHEEERDDNPIYIPLFQSEPQIIYGKAKIGIGKDGEEYISSEECAKLDKIKYKKILNLREEAKKKIPFSEKEYRFYDEIILRYEKIVDKT